MKLRSVIVLAVTFGAACSTVPVVPSQVDDLDADAVFTFAAALDASLPDPQQTTVLRDAAVVNMVFEPLLALDPKTLRPAPGAAALPTISTDGLRHRFTLREGLKYSDGVPVRASDYAYGISRLCDPATAPAGYVPTWIVGCSEWVSLDPDKAKADDLSAARRNLLTQGIIVLGDRELELRLRVPALYSSSFLSLWLSAPTRQRDVERNGDNWYLDPANYIGNGPFVLTEWIQGKRMVFDRNPLYRTPSKVRRIVRVVAEGAAALAMYQEGKLDRVPLDAGVMPAVEAAGLDKQMTVTDGGCTSYLLMNHTRPPLDDPKVRLALAKAIDRTAYLREFQAFGRVPSSFIAPGFPGHDPDDDIQSFDAAAARRLLTESRYAGTATLDNIVWHIGSGMPPARKREADWVVNQWRAIGLDVKVQVIDKGQFQTQQSAIPTRAMFFKNGWCADYPDQQDWLSAVFGTIAQRGPVDYGYRSPSVEKMLADADRGTDQAIRDQLYLKASRALSADVPAIFLSYNLAAALNKPWVGGLNESPLDAGGFLRPGEVFVRHH